MFGWHPRTGVVAARALDLDDRCAEVSEQHRAVGSGQNPRQIRHNQPVEWTRRVPVERTPRVVVVRTAGGVRCHGTVTFDVERTGGWTPNRARPTDVTGAATSSRRSPRPRRDQVVRAGVDGAHRQRGCLQDRSPATDRAAPADDARATRVRALVGGAYALTTKTLELGTACIAAQGIWDVARPHMLALVGKTGESSSMSQLDGSDIVYMARVPVAKIIAISVHIEPVSRRRRRRWAMSCSPT